MDLEIARTRGVTKKAHRASLLFATDPEKAPGEEIMVVLNPRKYLCRRAKYESIFLFQGSCEENMASSRSLDLSLAGDLEGLEMVRRIQKEI